MKPQGKDKTAKELGIPEGIVARTRFRLIELKGPTYNPINPQVKPSAQEEDLESDLRSGPSM